MEWYAINNSEPVEGIRAKLVGLGLLGESVLINKKIPKVMDPMRVRDFSLDCVVDSEFGVLFGSGSFHHLTYFVCRDWADRLSHDYDLFVFDAHNDTKNSWGMGCASFIPWILEKTYAKDLFVVGVDHFLSIKPSIGDRVSFVKANNFGGCDMERFMGFVEGSRDDVYISVDLDVLKPSHASTDYNQGALSAGDLVDCLGVLGEEKRVVGFDINGHATRSEPDLRTVVSIASLVNVFEGVYPKRDLWQMIKYAEKGVPSSWFSRRFHKAKVGKAEFWDDYFKKNPEGLSGVSSFLAG